MRDGQAVSRDALGSQIEEISGGLKIACSEIARLNEAIRDSNDLLAMRAKDTRTVLLENLGALGARINALGEEVRRTREMIDVGNRLTALEMRVAPKN